MEEKEKEIIYQAIRSHGDDFWNDSEGGWNGYLFEDILKYLSKDGFDLKLVKL